MTAQFASTIPSPLPGGSELRLRYVLPSIWTQRGAAGARPFAIYWSEGDGLGRLHPQPTDEELHRFYDTSSYDEYMGERRDAGPDAGAPPRPGFATRMLARIAWRADRGQPLTAELLHGKVAKVPARVVDLGCGAGSLLTELARRGHDVLGVDPSPVALANAARIGLRVLQGTAEALPAECPRSAFDLVVMSHSLEHCREPLAAMRNAASLLAANGLLVCDVPNHACAGFRAQGPAWFHTDAGRHLWFFTPRSLRRLAEHADLHVAGFEFDGFARQFGWLAAEQQVWDALYGAPVEASLEPPVDTPPRPSLRSQLRVLWRGLVGGAEHRYDAVRLLARRQ